jgi:uncharacterized protein YbjT (DUF2867 family)
MRVLVVGGYGFVGLEILRQLNREGMAVTGLGRSAAFGRRLAPWANWIGADIARLTAPADWRGHLEGIDAVVNASGALQDGLRDRLELVQGAAITALIEACAEQGIRRFVQISAPGAEPEASTTFMTTKARADAHLRASGLDWIILKPGLVLGPNAYGGSALLRMLASCPLVLPIILADRPVQTVAIGDVAGGVVLCLQGAVPVRNDYDLVEERPGMLCDVVLAMRAWLGWPEPWHVVVLPRFVGRCVSVLADAAGWPTC